MADRQFDRRTVLRGTGLVGIAGVAGCISTNDQGNEGDTGDTDTPGDEGGDETPTDTDTATSTPEPTNVGMVYALGGLGDKSFNDMAHKGIKQAADEMAVSFQNAEPGDASEMKTLQRKFAQSSNPDYDLIPCIGFTQTNALKENAGNFPDQKWMIVDSVVDSDNVASYVFKEHEGSFQVGHMAGLLTTMDFGHEQDGTTYTTNDDAVVGFVGGKQNSVIDRFEAGYRAGVAHVDDSIEVRTAYAGSWSDPATGQEIALSMYEKGADIVYHAAGGTGIGVFKAARNKQRFAVGVDADQSRSSNYDDVIVASMVKRVDTAVYQSVKNVVEGSFAGGEIVSLGLANGGVEPVIGQSYEDEIPDSVTGALSESKSGIVDGDISVPTTPEDL